MASQGREELGGRGEGSVTGYARDLYGPEAARREEAARQIWLRFSERLDAEVRRRLNARYLPRVGVEDVTQSLFASFVLAAPGPDGPPCSRAELWRVLVHFTICKVAKTVRHHQAKGRDVRRSLPLGDVVASAVDSRPFDPEDPRGLDPADEAIARAEFDRLLGVLPGDLREVLVMRLEGYSNAQIAAKIGRVERTVELKMGTIRRLLRPHIDDVAIASGDESTDE